MHDTTVEPHDQRDGLDRRPRRSRSTKALRLKEGLGDAQAAVTDRAGADARGGAAGDRGRGALINLDKAWAFRDQIYGLLVATGTLETAVFKSTAPVAEVEAFRARDPRIMYSHMVDDANAGDLTKFGAHPPESFEIIFDRLTDPQIQPAAVAGAQGRQPDLHQHHVVRPRRPLHRRGVADRPGARAGRRSSTATTPTSSRPTTSTSSSAGCAARTSPSRDPLTAACACRPRTTRPRARTSATTTPRTPTRAAPRRGPPRASTCATSRARSSRATSARASGSSTTSTSRARARTACSAGSRRQYRPAGRLTVDFPGIGTSAPVDVRNTTSHDAFAMQELRAVDRRSPRAPHVLRADRPDRVPELQHRLPPVRSAVTADPPAHVVPAGVGGVVAGTLALEQGVASRRAHGMRSPVRAGARSRSSRTATRTARPCIKHHGTPGSRLAHPNGSPTRSSAAGSG